MPQEKRKKISAFLPEGLLKEAVAAARDNQTETIITALKELVQKHRRIKALMSLKKIHIDYDIEAVRQRRVM